MRRAASLDFLQGRQHLPEKHLSRCHEKCSARTRCVNRSDCSYVARIERLHGCAEPESFAASEQVSNPVQIRKNYNNNDYYCYKYNDSIAVSFWLSGLGFVYKCGFMFLFCHAHRASHSHTAFNIRGQDQG